jgi:non-specific serine/threonine protein kinase
MAFQAAEPPYFPGRFRSYDLLAPAEQGVLARLAVFAGGFDLPAAEAVCAGAPAGPAAALTPGAVAGPLARLVDRSLVAADVGAAPVGRDGSDSAAGSVRYRLLETVREYAAERLADEGHAAAAAVRQRHAGHYAALAERAAAALWGADQAAWLARLDAELDNLRAALAWGVAAGGDPEAGLRLAGALWRFWGRRGRAGEGRAHLERLLAGGAGAPALRARGLFAAAYLAWRQGDLAAARARGEAALALAEAAGDVPTALWARQGLGGTALAAGDPAAAEAVLGAGLVRARAAGQPVAVSWFLYFLGEAARARGDLPRAARRLEAGLARMRARGDAWSAGLVLLGLARVVAARGDAARAAALQRESLAAWRALGDAVGAAHALDELAQVALAGGQAPRAARLFGAAAALRERAGGAAWLLWQADRERALAAVRGALGEAPFAAAWAAGRALGLEAALAEAEAVAPAAAPR